jgi:hypothetical protein
MQRLLYGLLLLLPSACAIAFTPTLKPIATSAKFQDIERASSREELNKEWARPPSAPTLGMSLVVGGTPMDAGALPPSPIPIVSLQ